MTRIAGSLRCWSEPGGRCVDESPLDEVPTLGFFQSHAFFPTKCPFRIKPEDSLIVT